MIFVLPILLYPLLGMSFFADVQFRREQPTTRAGRRCAEPHRPIAAAVRGRRFVDAAFSRTPSSARRSCWCMRFRRRERPHAGSDPRQPEACRRGRVRRYDAALYFPADFAQRLERLRQAHSATHRDHRRPSRPSARPAGSAAGNSRSPEIIYTTANERSQIAHARLSEVLTTLDRRGGQSNLGPAACPPRPCSRSTLATTDVAEETAYRGAAVWSKMLPVHAVDLGDDRRLLSGRRPVRRRKGTRHAGNLLSSPAERSEIVLGKLLTIMLFSMVTAVVEPGERGADGLAAVGQTCPDFGPPPPLAAALAGAGPGAGFGLVQRPVAWRWRPSPAAPRKGNIT